MAKRKSNKITRFQRSQNAHADLNRKWRQKGNTAKNRAYRNYHADCYDEQKRLGRVLTRNERKKLFAYWWESEHK